MRSARRHLPLALAIVLLPFLACIDYDGQSLVFRYDPGADRLYVFQVYEGIHTSGDQSAPSPKALAKLGKKKRREVSPTDKERRELASVVKGQRTFFFGNWITEYDRQACVGDLAESRTKLAEAPPAEKAALQARMALCEQLIKSVKITNGEFYLNKDRRLCGYQFMVVEQVKKLLPLVNAAIRTLALTDKMEKYTPAERDQVRAFAEKATWVELNGNELRLRFYTRYDDLIEFRDDMFSKFKRSQIVINYNAPLVEVIIGRPGNARTELTTPATSKPDKRLIRYVRKTYGLAKKVDVAALRDAFLTSGTTPTAKPAPAAKPASSAKPTPTPASKKR